MKKIGIIGAGNMGGSIAQALSAEKDWQVSIFDTDRTKAESFSGCIIAKSMEELVENGQLLLLAVKPQVLPSLYPLLRKAGSRQKRWISIAAGVCLETLTENLGTDEVVRFMPNLAAQVRQSVTAVTPGINASPSLKETALSVAELFGTAFLLPEEQIAAFTGISGSAIAYVFQFFHALAMGGVKEGLPYPQSLAIARETCLSAAALQKKEKKNPIELATMVCSAGGTTIEGMQALAEGGFDATVMAAVSASSAKFRLLEEKARENGL
ncbi:MAG TPA: pyrroline-5-carboxylate reductase [Sphaerochaeta sp.]|nr:pyrroline-5-carboxylate reductase [Sphaerochaeta sp.]